MPKLTNEEMVKDCRERLLNLQDRLNESRANPSETRFLKPVSVELRDLVCSSSGKKPTIVSLINIYNAPVFMNFNRPRLMDRSGKDKPARQRFEEYLKSGAYFSKHGSISHQEFVLLWANQLGAHSAWELDDRLQNIIDGGEFAAKILGVDLSRETLRIIAGNTLSAGAQLIDHIKTLN